MPKYSLNPDTLLYEERDEPRYLKPVRIAVATLLAAGFVMLYFWIYTSVLHWELPRTAMLRREAAAWEAKMAVLDSRLDLYERTLTGIEQRDDEVYRSIYGLGAIPDEVKRAGLGGVNRYAAFDSLGGRSSLGWTVRRLDNLTKRAYLQSKALDEVGQLSREAGDMISCVPSVPPLLPDAVKVKLSSGFGYRTDPVYGGAENHLGQDFATAKGTPVYATGDGVVVSARFQFSGYGNEIVIDHGFGYKTRYAHLNTIIIGEGMKVRRGEQIGTVGTSGKVTGAHLHYEVIYQNNRVNPMNFMDFNMPLEEYRAMVDKRREDSPVGKRSSTTELLRRRRNGRE